MNPSRKNVKFNWATSIEPAGRFLADSAAGIGWRRLAF
jgi:hypothetical protein